LFIKSVAVNAGRAELLEIFGKCAGFQHLTLSEPLRHKQFNRLGWAMFDTKENALTALNQLHGTKLKDRELQLAINKVSNETSSKYKITPPVAAEDTRIMKDLSQATNLCKELDKCKGIEDNPLFAKHSEDDKLLSTIKLDRLIGYLRKVHFFCYYCGEEFDDEEELNRKCGQKHFRGKKNETNPVNVATDAWANSVDTKLKAKLENPDNYKVATAQQLTDKKTTKFYNKYVNKIEEEKYRCGVCSKLFMGESFVRKHLSLKHIEDLELLKQKALDKQFFENYFNDPRRIVPNTSQQTYLLPSPIQRSQNRRGGLLPPPIHSMFPPAYIPPIPSGQYYTPQPTYRRGGGNRGNRGGYRGQRQNQPIGELEPPAGVTPDPRSLREYVDLDAPAEETVQIDYRLPEPRAQ